MNYTVGWDGLTTEQQEALYVEKCKELRRVKARMDRLEEKLRWVKEELAGWHYGAELMQSTIETMTKNLDR